MDGALAVCTRQLPGVGFPDDCDLASLDAHGDDFLGRSECHECPHYFRIEPRVLQMGVRDAGA